MKKCILAGLFSLSLLCTGCASYRAASLSALSPQFVKESEEIPGMSVGCKSFSASDCVTYLDRDVLKKGYQPVELTFYNQTDKSYFFSSNQVSLPCAYSQKVASSVHTSTAGRVVGYAVASPVIISTGVLLKSVGLVIWGAYCFVPLTISAVVDGICSRNSNKRLDKDFQDKAEDHFVIAPYSYRMTLLFIPKEDFSPNFNVALVEQDTGASKVLNVTASR